MPNRVKMVLAMLVAALAIFLLLYYFTGNLKLSLAVSGVMLALDLTFVPKLVPHLFEDKEDKDD